MAIQYFDILIKKLPPINDNRILSEPESQCELISLKKRAPLIVFLTDNQKIYGFIQDSS